MGSFCAYFGHRLFHDYKSKYARLASYFFLFLSISAFLGGSAHLLDLYLGKTPRLIAWIFQGFSILFFQLASLKLVGSSRISLFLRVVMFALIGVFIFQVIRMQHFDIVKMYSIAGLMGFVSIIHLFKSVREKNIVYLRVSLAIAVLAVPAMIHSFGVNFNKWVDQNVISHIILLPCFYLLYNCLKNVAISRKKTQPSLQSMLLKEK